MKIPSFKRIPKHIAVIPDGNRRWAQENGLEKFEGYEHGLTPGLDLYSLCLKLGVEELTFYGYTQDNTKRPKAQTDAFIAACIKSVEYISKLDAELLVVGNTASPLFPKELLPYTKRTRFGKGSIKVNFLVNYGWLWDLSCACSSNLGNICDNIGSANVSRVDLVVRWGGRHRLSGMLPIQTVYADTYVLEEMWPDFNEDQLCRALEWYQYQDVTLGG